jgi:hypothetical protein
MSTCFIFNPFAPMIPHRLSLRPYQTLGVKLDIALRVIIVDARSKLIGLPNMLSGESFQLISTQIHSSYVSRIFRDKLSVLFKLSTALPLAVEIMSVREKGLCEKN